MRYSFGVCMLLMSACALGAETQLQPSESNLACDVIGHQVYQIDFDEFGEVNGCYPVSDEIVDGDRLLERVASTGVPESIYPIPKQDIPSMAEDACFVMCFPEYGNACACGGTNTDCCSACWICDMP